jgi:hypothetical protein
MKCFVSKCTNEAEVSVHTFMGQMFFHVCRTHAEGASSCMGGAETGMFMCLRDLETGEFYAMDDADINPMPEIYRHPI